MDSIKALRDVDWVFTNLIFPPLEDVKEKIETPVKEDEEVENEEDTEEEE